MRVLSFKDYLELGKAVIAFYPIALNTGQTKIFYPIRMTYRPRDDMVNLNHSAFPGL